MTTATKLFLIRRSHHGRRSDREEKSDQEDPAGRHRSSSSHDSHHRRRREDSDLCLLRSREREPSRVDHGASSQLGFVGYRADRLGSMIGNGRLPGAVLDARERLLARLGNIPPTRNRQSAAADSRVLSGQQSDAPVDLPVPPSRFHSGPSTASKSSGGFAWEALCSKCQEVHGGMGDGAEGRSTADECPICLERFHEGDELIRLRCQHLFHPACLEPWLRSSRDCPYCRASPVC